MCLSVLKFHCRGDLVVSGVNGVEFVALKRGNTYEATDLGDMIAINTSSKTLTIHKTNFPHSVLELLL